MFSDDPRDEFREECSLSVIDPFHDLTTASFCHAIPFGILGVQFYVDRPSNNRIWVPAQRDDVVTIGSSGGFGMTVVIHRGKVRPDCIDIYERV
jgi:hypothetical protein